MCYSFQTSLISYTIGIISGVFALCTRQITLGLLILTYSQIQLAELLIWKGIDDNNIGLNKFGSSYGKYLLATHNIAIGIGIILSIIFISKQPLQIKDFIPLGVSILFFIFVVVFYYLPGNYPDRTFPLDPGCVDKSKKCQNPNNRLDWKWPHSWYLYGFIIPLLFLTLYVKPVDTKIWLSFIFIITLIISVFLQPPTTAGSIWCFSAAVLAPIIVLVNYFIIKDMNSVDILT